MFIQLSLRTGFDILISSIDPLYCLFVTLDESPIISDTLLVPGRYPLENVSVSAPFMYIFSFFFWKLIH